MKHQWLCLVVPSAGTKLLPLRLQDGAALHVRVKALAVVTVVWLDRRNVQSSLKENLGVQNSPNRYVINKVEIKELRVNYLFGPRER